MTAVVLYRINPEKRMHRYYRLDLQPDLFGQWCLMKAWGPIGCTGQERSVSFSTHEEAEAAFIKQRTVKERRGYFE